VTDAVTEDFKPEDFVAADFAPQNLLASEAPRFDYSDDEEFPDYLQPNVLPVINTITNARVIGKKLITFDNN
jgi:hypothetical protein